MKTLKFGFAAAIFCILLACTGCDLLENLIKIPIDVNSQVTIPAGTGIGTLGNIFADEQETNIEEELAFNDSRKDRVKTVDLRQSELTITSPSGQDFSFLNDIEVFLSDEELGDRRIAYRNDIPDNVGNKLVLQVEGGDLADYLKKESIQIKTSVTTDEVLLQPVNVNIYTRFRVTADVF